MSTELFSLKGKVALVTGSTHGLGMAMAKGLGLAGAKLIVNGNSSQTKIDDAVAFYKSFAIIWNDFNSWKKNIGRDICG